MSAELFEMVLPVITNVDEVAAKPASLLAAELSDIELLLMVIVASVIENTPPSLPAAILFDITLPLSIKREDESMTIIPPPLLPLFSDTTLLFKTNIDPSSAFNPVPEFCEIVLLFIITVEPLPKLTPHLTLPSFE